MSALGQELGSERGRTTDLQKGWEQNKESLTTLQSDFYGKESEVSALRQDMRVGTAGRKEGYTLIRLNPLNPQTVICSRHVLLTVASFFTAVYIRPI